MKMNLTISGSKAKFLGLVMILVFNCGAAQAQLRQGLMSRLIEIKYSNELYLTTQIKNETNPAKAARPAATKKFPLKINSFILLLTIL